MKAKHKLEHIIYNSWKKHSAIGALTKYSGKIVIGVSAGNDSMALLRGLMACFPLEKLVVLYAHHGGSDEDTLNYRNRAQRTLFQFCHDNAITFEVVTAQEKLSSEAEFRSFRLGALKTICGKYQANIVALAHHRDDWLENQLIKLIRGSSFRSLRQPFQWAWASEYNFFIWRPLTECRRNALESYVQLKKLPFVEDPSNGVSKYLRNWIRNTWLPMLEHKRPGGVHRLALSLINSIQEMKAVATAFPWDFQENSIDLIYFLSLSEAEKMRCLAYFISSSNLKSVKTSQIKEIIRQLDKNTDRYHIHFKTFDCLVNAGQLIIRIH